MSSQQSNISRFFKPKQAQTAGNKRIRPNDDVVEVEIIKVSKKSQLSTNAVEAIAQNAGRTRRQQEPAKPEEKKLTDVVEIDLDDDDDDDDDECVREVPSIGTKSGETSDNKPSSVCLIESRQAGDMTEAAPTTNAVTRQVKAPNPFAMFACMSPSSSAASGATDRTAQRATWKEHTREHPKQVSHRKAPTKPSSKSTGKSKEGFVKMSEISKEEQDRITKKWHSLADPKAPLEVRRYQVVLAARLHARCQEPTVRKAMTKLREAMAEGVTVDTVARMDPKVLAGNISNLQFYNVKAQQVVKAAQEIQTMFGGKVPEDELSLTKLTGIGKCFADLLAFVNTRKKHQESAAQKQPQCQK